MVRFNSRSFSFFAISTIRGASFVMNMAEIIDFLDLRIGCRAVGLGQSIVGTLALKHCHRTDRLTLQLRIQLPRASIVQNALSLGRFALRKHEQRMLLHVDRLVAAQNAAQ